MLDFKAQSQFADATAAMMRSCAIVATSTLARSATQGLSLWSQMLRATNPSPWSGWPWPAQPMRAPGWMPFAQSWTGPSLTAWMPLTTDWASAWSRGTLPGWGGMRLGVALERPIAEPPAAAGANGSDQGFASYRSAGGHASAQVIIPARAAAPTDAAAALVFFSPMQTMLDLWRNALRV